MKFLKNKFLGGFCAVFLLLQSAYPEQNDAVDLTHDISNEYEIPDNVGHVIDHSCMACHSNKSEYPWFAKIQPIGWMIHNKVEQGKSKLNFSEFAKLTKTEQKNKFKEIIKKIHSRDMPASDSPIISPENIRQISDDERELIIHWANIQIRKVDKRTPQNLSISLHDYESLDLPELFQIITPPVIATVPYTQALIIYKQIPS